MKLEKGVLQRSMFTTLDMFLEQKISCLENWGKKKSRKEIGEKSKREKQVIK